MKRLRSLGCATAVLILGGAFCSAAAYGDRSGVSFGLQRRSVSAPAFALPALDRSASKPADPRLRLAHAIIVRTSPDKGAPAPEDVGRVEVWYDAGIRDDFVALAVIDAAGERVDRRDAAIDATDQSHVFTSVGRLAPGAYTVRYRAISADGHQVSGAWVFEVRHD